MFNVLVLPFNNLVFRLRCCGFRSDGFFTALLGTCFVCIGRGLS